MEEPITSLSDLERLNSEIDGLFSDLKGKEDSYVSRILALEQQLADLKAFQEKFAVEAGSREKDLRAALAAAREETLGRSVELEKMKSVLADLQARGESASRLLEEEKARCREKEVLLSGAKAAVRDKELEVSRLWNVMEEVKAQYAALQGRLADKEAELERASRARQIFELEMHKVSADAAKDEQGFYHKIELLKKELREKDKEAQVQARRFSELEKKGDEAFTELASAREELRSALAAAEEMANALKAEKEKSLRLERELQAPGARPSGGGRAPVS
ncbi:MAG: hypothetical protein WCW52_06380 [Elusimicrobiales bacterium]|jgi:hypothetical protein